MDLLKKSWKVLNKSYKKKLINLIIFNFIVIIFELFTLGVLVKALNIFTENSTSSHLNFLHDFGKFFDDDHNLLISIIILFFLIYLIKSVLLVLFYSKQFQFTYDLRAKLTSNVFSHYMSLPYSFHLEKNTDELIRNVGNEVSLVSTGIIHQLIVIGTELLIIASIILFLFFQSPIVILILFISFSLVGILYYLITSRKVKKLGHLRQSITTDVLKKTINSLYGIKDIKILGKENYFKNLYTESTYELSRVNRIISIFGQIPKIIIEMSLITIIGIIVFKLASDISEAIKVGGLLIFAGLRLMPSVAKIISSFQNLKYNKPAMDVVYDILQISETNILINNEEKFFDKIKFEKNIEFQNVKFNYKDGRQIFNGINIQINKGDKIGIFGKSGNGKSTFIDLLSSLISPSSGKILIDGKELDNLNKIDWRSKIGYVPQQVYIQDDTLRKNIALGVEDENIDDDKIKLIIKKTNLENLKSYENLDQVLNIKISSRGLNISGGELQRIALARSLYVDSEILILDEATNALDEKNKNELISNIFELYNDKTIIFISHEDKIFKKCNRVFELEDKKLSEN